MLLFDILEFLYIVYLIEKIVIKCDILRASQPVVSTH